MKYENGLPCDFSLAETQPRSEGLYHFRKKTQFPRNFVEFARKSMQTFSLQKILSPIKLDEKAGILRCGQVEAIIRFMKNMMTERSFYY